MKEFKFTGTMRPERILPYDKFRNDYQSFRHDLVVSTGNSYPEVEVVIHVRDRRQEWIDKWYSRAVNDCHVNLLFRKDVVIAQYYDNIATAAPVHNDKYDRHTGIAVAYAKLIGESIPDYI